MTYEFWQSPRLATAMIVLYGCGIAISAGTIVTLLVRERPIPHLGFLMILAAPLMAGGLIVTYVWWARVYGELWPFTVWGGWVGAVLLGLFVLGLIAASTANFQLPEGASLNAEELERTRVLNQQMRAGIYMAFLSWYTGNALFAGPRRNSADVAREPR